MNDIEKIKEFDKLKTKVLKYIMYKKRTENEVRQKFLDVNQDDLEQVIEELKEIGYIDDGNYIKRAVNEFMTLKNMSIKEIRYKLLSKALNKNLIDEYIQNNIENLLEYEINSAKKIIVKKANQMEKEDIIIYLNKKGYKPDTIKGVMDE